MKFITLHSAHNKEVVVQKDYIAVIEEYGDGSHVVVIKHGVKISYFVKETPKEVLDKMTD